MRQRNVLILALFSGPIRSTLAGRSTPFSIKSKMEPMRDYVEQRKGEYYVAGTRVPLECVTQELLRGASPETIRESYPLLTLAHGAIACYLDHQAAMDDHFRKVDKTYDEFRAAQRPISPELR